jgi:hypothetical protein
MTLLNLFRIGCDLDHRGLGDCELVVLGYCHLAAGREIILIVVEIGAVPSGAAFLFGAEADHTAGSERRGLGENS